MLTNAEENVPNQVLVIFVSQQTKIHMVIIYEHVLHKYGSHTKKFTNINNSTGYNCLHSGKG